MYQTDREALDTEAVAIVDAHDLQEKHAGPQLLDTRFLRRVGGGVGEPPPGAADLPKGGW